MPHYKFVVFSDPAPGQEAAYNAWYDDVHLGEVTAIPGFTGAARFRLVPSPDEAPRHRYLAIYDIESDDVAGSLAELPARIADGRIRMSDALGAVRTLLFEALPPTVPPAAPR